MVRGQWGIRGELGHRALCGKLEGHFVQRRSPWTVVLGQRQPHGWALLAETVEGCLQGSVFLEVLLWLLLEMGGAEPPGLQRLDRGHDAHGT